LLTENLNWFIWYTYINLRTSIYIGFRYIYGSGNSEEQSKHVFSNMNGSRRYFILKLSGNRDSPETEYVSENMVLKNVQDNIIGHILGLKPLSYINKYF
jgi:hypothetical protein